MHLLTEDVRSTFLYFCWCLTKILEKSSVGNMVSKLLGGYLLECESTIWFSFLLESTNILLTISVCETHRVRKALAYIFSTSIIPDTLLLY